MAYNHLYWVKWCKKGDINSIRSYYYKHKYNELFNPWMPHVRDKNNKNGFEYALLGNHTEIVEFYIKHLTDIKCKKRHNQKKVYKYAFDYKYIEILVKNDNITIINTIIYNECKLPNMKILTPIILDKMKEKYSISNISSIHSYSIIGTLAYFGHFDELNKVLNQCKKYNILNNIIHNNYNNKLSPFISCLYFNYKHIHTFKTHNKLVKHFRNKLKCIEILIKYGFHINIKPELDTEIIENNHHDNIFILNREMTKNCIYYDSYNLHTLYNLSKHNSSKHIIYQNIIHHDMVNMNKIIIIESSTILSTLLLDFIILENNKYHINSINKKKDTFGVIIKIFNKILNLFILNGINWDDNDYRYIHQCRYSILRYYVRDKWNHNFPDDAHYWMEHYHINLFSLLLNENIKPIKGFNGNLQITGSYTAKLPKTAEGFIGKNTDFIKLFKKGLKKRRLMVKKCFTEYGLLTSLISIILDYMIFDMKQLHKFRE